MKTEKNVKLSAGERLKEVLQPSPLQVVGNQRSARRFGFQSPIVKIGQLGLVESLRQKVRGKVG